MTDRSAEDRLTELELRYMTQEDLLQELESQVREANQTIDRLRQRCDRLEAQVMESLSSDAPANERPPHY